MGGAPEATLHGCVGADARTAAVVAENTGGSKTGNASPHDARVDCIESAATALGTVVEEVDGAAAVACVGAGRGAVGGGGGGGGGDSGDANRE